jgi:hypothetical protein
MRLVVADVTDDEALAAYAGRFDRARATPASKRPIRRDSSAVYRRCWRPAAS